jgi:hypothetical protein
MSVEGDPSYDANEMEEVSEIVQPLRFKDGNSALNFWDSKFVERRIFLNSAEIGSYGSKISQKGSMTPNIGGENPVE